MDKKFFTLASSTKEQRRHIGIRDSPPLDESANAELNLNGSPPPPPPISPSAPIERSSRNFEFELPEPPMPVQDLIEDLKLVNTHVARKGISKSYLNAFEKNHEYRINCPISSARKVRSYGKMKYISI